MLLLVFIGPAGPIELLCVPPQALTRLNWRVR